MSAICKRLLRGVCLLAAALLLCPACARQPQRFQFTYLDVFDTVTSVTVYADTRSDAEALAGLLHGELLACHRLFDVYHEYEGMNNLCTVNRLAGGAPVKVDGRITELLRFAAEMGKAGGGVLNVCMGSVLSLWHEARELAIAEPGRASIPDEGVLRAAQAHISPDALCIDEAASAVWLTDPEARLDVGAVAKGWAVQRACSLAVEKGYGGFLVSAGGNVVTVGTKPDGSLWRVAVEDPTKDGASLTELALRDCAAVTSGSYQRYFTVDGVRYHHIIDPVTGYPAKRYQMVTVICPDSGAADALSTSLFLLPAAEGAALAERFGAQALWMWEDGHIETTAGFPEPAKN